MHVSLFTSDYNWVKSWTVRRHFRLWCCVLIKTKQANQSDASHCPNTNMMTQQNKNPVREESWAQRSLQCFIFAVYVQRFLLSLILLMRLWDADGEISYFSRCWETFFLPLCEITNLLIHREIINTWPLSLPRFLPPFIKDGHVPSEIWTETLKHIL